MSYNITISNSVSVPALLNIYHGFKVMGVNSTVTENELKNSRTPYTDHAGIRALVYV